MLKLLVVRVNSQTWWLLPILNILQYRVRIEPKWFQSERDHGDNTVFPKGTEVTAFVNGDVKLDPAGLAPL